MRKEKTIQIEGIRLPEDRTINDIGLTPCKYFTILESEDINHQEMKETSKRNTPPLNQGYTKLKA